MWYMVNNLFFPEFFFYWWHKNNSQGCSQCYKKTKKTQSILLNKKTTSVQGWMDCQLTWLMMLSVNIYNFYRIRVVILRNKSCHTLNAQNHLQTASIVKTIEWRHYWKKIYGTDKIITSGRRSRNVNIYKYEELQDLCKEI